MYKYVQRMRELFDLLEDRLSRDVFLARIQCDIEPSLTNISKISDLCRGIPDRKNHAAEWKNMIYKLNQKDEKIVLYGTAVQGHSVAENILREGMDFYAFVSRGAERFQNGLLGKPVMTPDWLFENKKCYVIIASSGDNYNQIRENLLHHDYPEERLLPCYRESLIRADRDQYFVFPDLIKDGAFVDGGCFDGQNSIDFCGFKGKSQTVFAFEPDAAKIALCEANMKKAGLSDYRLMEAGLSDAAKTADFMENSSGGSYILSEWNIESRGKRTREIQTVRVDDVVGKHTVGMIKMDIEGSELSALHGAERTIVRDQPFLAISVYHKPGDVLAIMDYCQRINPGYHFALRHHGEFCYETAMYASMDSFPVTGT